MVSNVKFFSFKKPDLISRHPFQTLVTVVLIFVVVATEPYFIGFVLIAAYVASGAVSTYYYYGRPPGHAKTRGRVPSPAPSP